MYTLGISCYYHDSAAALLKNGDVIAAVEEERFSREKFDDGFPKLAIDWCLKETQVKKLQKSGLREGFLDSLKKTIKQLTDKDLEKISKKHNKQVADFLSDFKKNPRKYGY